MMFQMMFQNSPTIQSYNLPQVSTYTSTFNENDEYDDFK